MANDFKTNWSGKISFLSIFCLILLSNLASLISVDFSSSALAKNDKASLFRNEDFVLSSLAFKPGQKIGKAYTADGADLSPPLSWVNPPPSTISYAITVEDPDAPSGTWTHWIIYDIPAKKRDLREGIKSIAKLPDGSIQALNSFHKIGYGGPSPPPGSMHRYFFRLYALDTFSYSVPLFSPPGTDMQKFKNFLNLHTKAKSELMATYARH